MFLHLTGNFIFFPAGTAFVPESPIISENISSGLRRATHSVCAGGRQCGGMWVSSVSEQQTVCRSPDLRGIGGEMRRQTPPHTSQPPPPHRPILMHRQIRVKEKIEGLCACVWATLTRNHWVFKLNLYVCVCAGCICLHVCAHMLVIARVFISALHAKL